MGKKSFDLDIVIPVFNEQDNLEKLVKELMYVFISGKIRINIIFVDDNSNDSTWETILRIRKSLEIQSDKINISAVKLRKNVGQFQAIEIGLELSRASFTLIMDGDMQHPPSVALELWNRRMDAETIAARQTKRKDAFLKRQLSSIFYVFMSYLAGEKFPRDVSDFRILNTQAREAILKTSYKQKIIRFLVVTLGIKQELIDYEPNERGAGQKSTYTLRKMIRLARESIVITSPRILRLGIYLFAIYFLFLLATTSYVIYLVTNGTYVPGWASIMFTILFSFLWNFLILGIFGIFMISFIEGNNKTKELRIAEHLSIDYDRT